MSTQDKSFDISRRHLLQGAGAAAGAAALGLPANARAQAGGRVVMGTWGGDYARLLKKNIEDPLLVPKGFECIQDQAGDSERRAKMRAELRLPRGTTDIQGLSTAQVVEMAQAGAAEEIDLSKVPNAKNVLPVLIGSKFGLPHIYSAKVVLYNPKLVPTPPTGFADLFDPKMAGKVGLIDIQYQFVIMSSALVGGKITDFEQGKKNLSELKKIGFKMYPTNEALAAALKAEEIGLCMMWKARAVQWQNQGIPVKTIAPKEGVPLYISEFMIPKNAPNKAGAYAYMNAMLEPSAQQAFAVDMGYNPTVTNAPIAADLKERIGFTAEEEKRLVNPDYELLAAKNAEIKDWWDKTLKG